MQARNNWKKHIRIVRTATFHLNFSRYLLKDGNLAARKVNVLKLNATITNMTSKLAIFNKKSLYPIGKKHKLRNKYYKYR